MALRERRRALLEQAELTGEAFCAAYAAEADAWLTGLLSDAAGGDTEGVALVAVGGYGRGELCPHSDLDVVLVHQSRRDVAALADAVWYPVWDQGVRLDHSVRTPAEVLHVARDDLRAQLGLLDGRVVAGDPTAAEPTLARARELWRSRPDDALGALARQVEARHHQHGDVAFLLEPDLKEAHGGLRDLAALHAAVLGAPELARHADLDALAPARRVLLAARVQLHRRAARGEERLLLQEQDQVAATLGYDGADALMAAVSNAGRAVAYASDDVWRRRAIWAVSVTGRRRWRARRGGSGSDELGAPRLVEPGVAVVGDERRTGVGEALLGEDADLRDVTLPLRLAAVAAERSLAIDPDSLARLAAAAGPVPDPWPPALRFTFVRTLAAGPTAVAAFEALDHHGLLAPLLPEWSAVRNKPQRNAYHRFTVDRHLLEAAAQAAPLAVRVARPDLLLLGALLHDIGKGYPGDHTEVGIELVGRIGARMGLPGPDVSVLQSLVRNHLLLPDLATRRDIDDPGTVAAVLTAVGDRDTLELLRALTQADSVATGPAASGPWKTGLVDALCHRVKSVLDGEAPPPTTAANPLLADIAIRAAMTAVRGGGPVVVAAAPSEVAGEPPRVTVVAPDRPGLLSAVAGVLALHALDVRAADVAGEDGVAVEAFVVEPLRGRAPDWGRVAGDVDDALAGRLDLPDRLARQAEAYAPVRRPFAARPTPTAVIVDNGASATSTVVEVRAPDALGLLHQVTGALHACELDVVAARVSTLGHEVVDAFYVRDRDGGGKVLDPARLAAVDRAVRTAVEAVAA